MRYAFECATCGKADEFETRTPIDGHVIISEGPIDLAADQAFEEAGDDGRCPGPWKRRWSFAVAWPMSDRGH